MLRIETCSRSTTSTNCSIAFTKPFASEKAKIKSVSLSICILLLLLLFQLTCDFELTRGRILVCLATDFSGILEVGVLPYNTDCNRRILNDHHYPLSLFLATLKISFRIFPSETISTLPSSKLIFFPSLRDHNHKYFFS